MAAALFWLAVWQIAAFKVGRELILPGPIVVIRTLLSLTSDSEFWLASGLTLLRIFSGFLAGLAAGTMLSVLTCSSRLCSAVFSPAIKVVRAVPVASFIILILLWVNRGFVPGVVSALIVVPVVWQSTEAAIKETDGNLLEMAGIYGLGRWKTIRYIYVPSVLPAWTASAENTLGLAWKSGVAAEVLCLPKLAVGTQLYYSKIYLETPSLFAWTAVIIILSFFVEYVLVKIIRGVLKND